MAKRILIFLLSFIAVSVFGQTREDVVNISKNGIVGRSATYTGKSQTEAGFRAYGMALKEAVAACGNLASTDFQVSDLSVNEKDGAFVGKATVTIDVADCEIAREIGANKPKFKKQSESVKLAKDLALYEEMLRKGFAASGVVDVIGGVDVISYIRNHEVAHQKIVREIRDELDKRPTTQDMNITVVAPQ